LLSNGAEEGKGSPLGKEAYVLLQNDKSINFEGNLEASFVLRGWPMWS
jgi:glycerol-3-phosphate acyltransferase PlsX